MAKLAQAHGLNPNIVFKWRRQLRADLFEGVAHSTAVMLPVALPAAPTGETSEPASLALQHVEPHRESVSAASGIKIELNGARVRVTGMVDHVQLRLVLRCLMPAFLPRADKSDAVACDLLIRVFRMASTRSGPRTRC